MSILKGRLQQWWPPVFSHDIVSLSAPIVCHLLKVGFSSSVKKQTFVVTFFIAIYKVISHVCELMAVSPLKILEV